MEYKYSQNFYHKFVINFEIEFQFAQVVNLFVIC